MPAGRRHRAVACCAAARSSSTTSDAVLKASAPAYALGLVRGTAAASSEELADLVRQVRRDGQIRETELVMPRGRRCPPRHVTARVAPLEHAGWCWRWSRTAPASAGSRRSAATSSPTSATS